MYKKIFCVYSSTIVAKKYLEIVKHQVDKFYSPEEADLILVLGGDGFLLKTIHTYLKLQKPIYGANCGSVGFMLNNINEKENIIETINKAVEVTLIPVQAKFTDPAGNEQSAVAFNEISIVRNTPYAAHLSIKVNNNTLIDKLVGDGVLVGTPSGSTAYNRACGGKIIGLHSNLLALTAINPFNPINWKAPEINKNNNIEIEVHNHEHRKVGLCCDFTELGNINKVTINLATHVKANLLFDKENSLDKKILAAQNIDNHV